ncbi:uncharacterized protein FIBRA_00561 [Fibroporia radiculosa]|uniref:F-box domain-containing protein n=1 Tax=Fibroporia radiculosa TaxID=599839 RepID=J4I803_9APHY|nr:uncharacterized protein FIBRA_00561 [Fibroporia radiculosa]CCL98561.1 predicted protein [Fibroporia radiculosa]
MSPNHDILEKTILHNRKLNRWADVLASEQHRITTAAVEASASFQVDKTARIVTAPVNRLPNEILTEVMVIARDLDTTSPMKWIALTHVCRHWREMALATPMLWSTIHARVSLPYLCASLERAADALVSLSIYDTRPAVTKVIQANAVRIVSLTTYTYCLQLLAIFMPRLQKLELHGNGHPYILLHSRNEHLPQLRTLLLDSLSLPLSSPWLKKLTRLELSRHPHYLIETNFTEFLNALNSCVDLEILKIDQRSGDHPGFTDDLPSSNVAFLPKLRILGLIGKIDDLNILLRHLVFPPTIYIQLEGAANYYWDEEAGPTVAVVLPPTPTLSSLLKTASTLELTASSNLELQAWRHEETEPMCSTRIEMAEWGPSGSTLFQTSLFEVVHLFSDAQVKCLALAGPQALLHIDAWTQIFSTFPTLTRLELHGNGCIGDFIQIFGARAGESLVCPGLVSLKLGYLLTYEASDLARALASRIERGRKLYCLQIVQGAICGAATLILPTLAEVVDAVEIVHT